MVEDALVPIIKSNLHPYVNEDSVKSLMGIGYKKSIFDIGNYHFEIFFKVPDISYQVKMEKICDDQSKIVVNLTKSKKFGKEIKRIMKKNKFYRKSDFDHCVSFSLFLKNLLKSGHDLSYIEKTYIPDLKFDGIFYN